MQRDSFDTRLKVMVAVLCALVVIVWYAISYIYRTEQAKTFENLWAEADGHFRQAQFTAAKEDYDKLLKKLQAELPRRDPQNSLAAAMVELCAACLNLKEALESQEASLFGPLAELEKLHAASFQEEADVDPDAGSEIGLAFPPTKRWQEVLSWIHNYCTNQLLDLAALDDTTEPQIDHLEVLVDFLAGKEYAQDLVETRRQIDNLRDKVALRTGHERFAAASQQAIASLDATAIQRASEQWHALRQRFHGRANAQQWQDHIAGLRAALGKRLRSSTVRKLAGNMDRTGPPQLSLAEYQALVATTVLVDAPREEGLVFAHVEDRCYAIHAADGELAWVCRVGYDARWLPQVVQDSRERLIVVPWERNGQSAITVGVADSLSVRWTWTLPAGEELAGPPVVVEDRLYVVLRDGSLWQLALSDGQAQAHLALPEPVHSPLVLREANRGDQHGAMLVGENLGVYLIELGPEPRVLDVLLPHRGPNSLRCRGMWIDPYVVVVENDLADKCRIMVFYKGPDDASYQQVKEKDMQGRLWHPPAVHGAKFVVVTDQHAEAVFVLNTSDPGNPLAEIFSQRPRRPDAPREPQFVSHPAAPFVAMLGSTVVKYYIDPLERYGRREVDWQRKLPHPDYVPMQPIQHRHDAVVVTARRPDCQAVRVESLDLQTGKVRWMTQLGAVATNWVVFAKEPGERTRAFVLSDAGELFTISRRRMRPAGQGLRQSVTDNVVGFHSPDQIAWVAGEPPQLYYVSPDGSAMTRRPLGSRAVSPLGAIEGKLVARRIGDSSRVPLNKRLVAFVDAAGQVQAKAVDQTDTSIQPLDLPPDAPREGWFRPIQTANGLLLSHPNGLLISLEIALDEGAYFLRQVARTEVLGEGIVGRPLLRGDGLWVAGLDARLRTFEATTLQPLGRVDLSAPASTPPLGQDDVYVGLVNGHVVVASGNVAQPKLIHDSDVSSAAIRFLTDDRTRGRIFAADARGHIYRLDPTGRVTGNLKGQVPLAIAPCVLRNALLTATVGGRLQSLPIP